MNNQRYNIPDSLPVRQNLHNPRILEFNVNSGDFRRRQHCQGLYDEVQRLKVSTQELRSSIGDHCMLQMQHILDNGGDLDQFYESGWMTNLSLSIYNRQQMDIAFRLNPDQGDYVDFIRLEQCKNQEYIKQANDTDDYIKNEMNEWNQDLENSADIVDTHEYINERIFTRIWNYISNIFDAQEDVAAHNTTEWVNGNNIPPGTLLTDGTEFGISIQDDEDSTEYGDDMAQDIAQLSEGDGSLTNDFPDYGADLISLFSSDVVVDIISNITI